MSARNTATNKKLRRQQRDEEQRRLAKERIRLRVKESLTYRGQ